MPATEETYRSQKTLHIVFAITSVVMTVTIVWMIMADHLRPWKQVQREFQKIETAKLSAQEREAKQAELEANKSKIDEINRQLKTVEARERENARAVRDLQAKIDTARGRFQKLDTDKRFKKAELDSLRSFYDGMIDRDERRRAMEFLVGSIRPSEQQYNTLSRQFEKVSQELDMVVLNQGLLRSNFVEVGNDPPPDTIAAKAGFRSGDELTVEDFRAMRDKVMATLQGESPAQSIRVVVRRRGKEVPLSVAVEPLAESLRPEFPEAAWTLFGMKATPITREVLTKRLDDLNREAARIANTLEQKEKQYGEGGFINGALAWMRGLPIIDLAAPPTKIQQITLPELTINYNFKDVPRFDRCTTCHQGIDRIGYDTTADGKPMPLVFHSHPHLTDGATAIDPKGNVVQAGLYLDGNGPHKINSFGCTICHGGQGSGTSFTFASHTPNDLKQREDWEKEHGWYEMHHWDEPMLPKRFLEASCLKCHHMVTDLNEHQAPKVLAGYKRITRYGCTGCHTIGGEGSFGPDLTDNRPVGPNLQHIGTKVSREWTLKWIKNPHAFRPDTRMPRFYGVTNNDAPKDQPKSDAEVHAITHYLFATSTAPTGFVDPPAKSDPAKGKELFLQKGCMACHSNRAYEAKDLPKALGNAWNSAYSIDPDKTYGPDQFPEQARDYAKAEFGPNLSSMAAKFPSRDQGYKWLTNWIQAPETYHAKSLMPNLQLTAQEAADIASWILSSRTDWDTGTDNYWPVHVEVPPVDSKEVKEGLDELVKLYLTKSKVYNKRTVLLSEIDSVVAQMSPDEKLMYVGEKTISRLGCFGCHNISGFENAKPIGTPLNGWGLKPPSRLDFGHIAEYIMDQGVDPDGSRDGTDEYYQEKLLEQTRAGFLYQKLHRPRSYDYKKDRDDLKTWDDRLRMPQFAWADDPVAIEEVMTFVLGLTGEKIPAKYLPNYDPPKVALAKGERLLERYNCRGCHTLAMPRYTIAADANLDRVFKSSDPSDASPFKTNVNLSYENRAKDYLAFYPGLTFKAGEPPLIGKADGKPVTLEGMPTFLDVQEDDQGRPVKTLYVQLWHKVEVRGYTFNVGDIVLLDPDQVTTTPAEGGDFAWLFSSYLSAQTGEPMPPLWNKLPPPLIREGKKVQTPWLTNFLQDPYKIRPAAQLRMPRFHYGYSPSESATESASGGTQESILAETRDLANYFAARDDTVFPYQEIPQREQAYLASRESIFGPSADMSTAAAAAKYLNAGWTLITKNQCVQCHAIGQYKPTGEEKSHGPNLRQVASRIRPEYMFEWISQPARIIPYTAMPQVFPPTTPPGTPPLPGIPKELEGKPLEQIQTVRDTLLNYVSAIEQQLATVAPPPEAPKPPTTASQTNPSSE